MRGNALFTGLGYALMAIALALLVIAPVFVVVNWIYQDGKGLTPLMIAVFACWLLLAVLLARRRVAL